MTRGGADRGKALECATFLALRRRFGEVCYWRDEGEVDFVVRAEGRIVPIQVSWDETLGRHQHALRKFYEQHPQADEAVFVTGSGFEEAIAAIESLR